MSNYLPLNLIPGADPPYDDLGRAPQINLAIPRASHGPWNHAPYMCKGRPTYLNSPHHRAHCILQCISIFLFSSFINHPSTSLSLQCIQNTNMGVVIPLSLSILLLLSVSTLRSKPSFQGL